jgi:dihydroorotase
VADLCLFDPEASWTVSHKSLRSQSKHTPFSGYEIPGRVRCTLVGGQVAFES